MTKLTNGNISHWRVSCRLSHDSTANHQSKSEIKKTWLSRLAEDHLQQSQQEKDSIIQWLLGESETEWNNLTLEQQTNLQQYYNDRYQILKQRYLNATATQAYQNLINRLCSLVVVHQNFQNWLKANRDGQRALLKVVQEVIQEMIQTEDYVLQQMKWIAQCTIDQSLRDRLLLVSIEEYSLRSVENQPLFLHRLLNYVRRNTRQKSVLMLLEPLMLEDVNQTLSENQDVHQFSKVMVEVRYRVISA
ncbi:hypothetical protein [Chroococcus sp. FPU101]|uniref:hypothetical protein n=1 Tax=Chroococcus sp. FPU101 TaxID=1974212 RepID=UPI001A8D43E1|nr:hypothetical protein [Chroococcus sp. FPU101]GFE71784.1 hypothetical protein CFPU101_43940 [Chroococcus sp. FPU101]